MTFGDHIRQARGILDLTQAELAHLLGAEKQSVSNWECGRGRPWHRREQEILSKLAAWTQRRREPVGDRI